MAHPSTPKPRRKYPRRVSPPPKPKDPVKVYPTNVRTLTGADFIALDAIVAARNARPGGRWSREMVLVELLRAAIARDPDAPT